MPFTQRPLKTWLHKASNMAKRCGSKVMPIMKAMQDMQVLMTDPKALQAWMEEKQRLFDALPED